MEIIKLIKEISKIMMFASILILIGIFVYVGISEEIRMNKEAKIDKGKNYQECIGWTIDMGTYRYNDKSAYEWCMEKFYDINLTSSKLK